MKLYICNGYGGDKKGKALFGRITANKKLLINV